MIHRDKDKFSKLVDRIASLTGFYAPLMEKDYYLTLFLSKINELSDNLIFKGGTCLNKIYYSYYRLSEDLDFSMRLPDYTTTRGNRRKCIQPVKDNIEEFAKQFDMRIEGAENAGRNVSKQYVYYLVYDSVLLPSLQTIKFEVGLRYNPILKPETKEVKHKFLNPFSDVPLFDGGKVNCLSLQEIVSEKLRAAAIRKTIAPRDFYDLDFIIRQGFNLTDKKVLKLFAKKIEEDNGDPDLAKYKTNLGRSDKEIKEMNSRIENELFDVLTVSEREHFDLDTALKRINKVMGKI
ncbi:MAG: nucleotidyl transferase AbiEii/AbiGii toxin family protein [Candidatus Omnitrophota bacterium]